MGKMSKIAAIDDDGGVIAMYGEILGNEFDLYLTTSPEDLIENIEEFNPDIAIIDLVIPERNGMEIISEIKKLCSPKILVISGASNSRLFERTMTEAQGFIPKPFEPYVVYQRIRSLLLSSGS